MHDRFTLLVVNDRLWEFFVTRYRSNLVQDGSMHTRSPFRSLSKFYLVAPQELADVPNASRGSKSRSPAASLCRPPNAACISQKSCIASFGWPTLGSTRLNTHCETFAMATKNAVSEGNVFLNQDNGLRLCFFIPVFRSFFRFIMD